MCIFYFYFSFDLFSKIVRRHSLALKEKRNAIIEKLAKRERKKNKKRKKEGER